jgi:hypothetical protein
MRQGYRAAEMKFLHAVTRHTCSQFNTEIRKILKVFKIHIKYKITEIIICSIPKEWNITEWQ